MFYFPLKRHLLSLVFSIALLFPASLFSQTAFALNLEATLTPDSGAPGTSVTVKGSGWEGDDQICIFWDSVANTSLTCTTSDQDGSFTANFTVPSNSSTETHRVYVDNMDHSIETTTVSFTVTPGQSSSPESAIDLQVIDIHALQSLVANSNPTFRADIRNNGSDASGDFNIRWIADGNMTFDGSDPSLAPGASTTHDHIWNQRGMGNLTAGQHTLTFIANFDHRIPESNYDNNQVTFTFTVS